MPQIIARASNTVRNKNIAMLVLCAGFLFWFTYDGFSSWPKQNDQIVATTLDKMRTMEVLPPSLSELQSWQGWNNESPENRKRMDAIIAGPPKLADGWHTSLDMTVQRWIVVGLIAAVAAAIWWFLHCQKRRAIAEENFVSPARGIEIPWDKIEVVDNTRWKSAGIVEITYTDSTGTKQKAKFDDYETDREPLIQILDQLAEKATKAEFIPKEEASESQ